MARSLGFCQPVGPWTCLSRLVGWMHRPASSDGREGWSTCCSSHSSKTYQTRLPCFSTGVPTPDRSSFALALDFLISIDSDLVLLSLPRRGPSGILLQLRWPSFPPIDLQRVLIRPRRPSPTLTTTLQQLLLR